MSWGTSVELAIDLCDDSSTDEGDVGLTSAAGDAADEHSVIDLCDEDDEESGVLLSWSAPSPRQRLEAAVRNGDVIEL
ncbi:hypothetical protein TrRE_jg11996 [Triparma retinervis]|uniref:Uncharacterized protein n=1 Tax=Triparma retinervis TaxID=2557542 RepID=A0A9W7CFZ1_9STRA|nr:hypothetical protein TrRE_jg11996 [Triparma retinervis]